MWMVLAIDCRREKKTSRDTLRCPAFWIHYPFLCNQKVTFLELWCWSWEWEVKSCAIKQQIVVSFASQSMVIVSSVPLKLLVCVCVHEEHSGLCKEERRWLERSGTVEIRGYGNG